MLTLAQAQPPGSSGPDIWTIITAVLAALGIGISILIARSANTRADKAIKTSENANKLSQGANKLSEGANKLATDANDLAREANEIAKAARQDEADRDKLTVLVQPRVELRLNSVVLKVRVHNKSLIPAHVEIIMLESSAESLFATEIENGSGYKLQQPPERHNGPQKLPATLDPGGNVLIVFRPPTDLPSGVSPTHALNSRSAHLMGARAIAAKVNGEFVYAPVEGPGSEWLHTLHNPQQ
ncbi:MAG: hypothetical protein ACREJO_00130 [Phycisphaerales bacterium]